MQAISWTGVGIRIVAALALVLLTYNPSGHSFYHWLTAPPAGITSVKALAGVLLLIGWVFCLRTAYVALGKIGLLLGAALLGTIVWVLVDDKLINVSSPSAFSWVVLAIVGVLLGIGLSWSLIRARTTGQVEVQ
jgi:hypothetical protein